MHRGLGSLLGTATAASIIGLASITHAQGTNPFGLQDRANAVSQMVILGVQQGISSLPPTSGQAFNYEYNPELGTFVQSETLGPTVLRSTQTIGANRLSLRFATSYFDLNKTLDPIAYQATGTGIPANTFTQFGLSADASVVLLNFALTYGLTDRVEVMVNIPVSIVDAQASQNMLVIPGTFPPASSAIIGALVVPPGASINPYLNSAVQAGAVNRVNASFGALGADFNSGTHAGLGRVGVGAKGLLGATDWGELTASAEFFCNSPNQAEFAGSNSPSILPRLIGQVHAAKHLNLHADIGEEHDFEVNELSRFIWNAGLSVPITNATFDVGVGGSKFDQPVQWTPVTATGGDGVTITAANPPSTQLGTNYIDFLFGVKVRLFEGMVLGGAVNVPITDDGFRPAAVGTLSLEYYFKPT